MDDPSLSRRWFLRSGVLAGAAAGALPERGRAAERLRLPFFEFGEITVASLQAGMESGEFTAQYVAERYLSRIHAIDKNGPGVNAVIELNPDALEIAAALDRERKEKGPRGPLHGVPVLIKDNIATHDRMQTTAGSRALVGAIPPRDSFV
ncbi:MAG: amidase family protein, partial [Terriglobia bacterium]